MSKEAIIQANSWLTPSQISELLKLDTYVEFIDSFSRIHSFKLEEDLFLQSSPIQKDIEEWASNILDENKELLDSISREDFTNKVVYDGQKGYSQSINNFGVIFIKKDGTEELITCQSSDLLYDIKKLLYGE